MNKKDLIHAVASHTEYPKKDIEGIVNGVFNEITNALYYGEEVNIASFGKFIVKRRTTRKVRNPQTGETMNIPAANVPVFRPAQKLKSAVL
ncbi:non-specific DNA-binding protein Hbs [Paenibacillus sp. JCM 10914]|uniref:HU family DNA-binding protein n=1 Tax=Paenibacillus sp. JCM 10914 TaxID=1236974 RepID=UPI0003CC7CA2|nr:HU family DNA-binding protein [Paenibacillus sp. JCM 10914]GAE05283.1 DNA-binding protein HBsu [Paenibacillus sp. JCM 10914]